MQRRCPATGQGYDPTAGLVRLSMFRCTHSCISNQASARSLAEEHHEFDPSALKDIGIHM